jgi:hypothetical protein
MLNYQMFLSYAHSRETRQEELRQSPSKQCVFSHFLFSLFLSLSLSLSLFRHLPTHRVITLPMEGFAASCHAATDIVQILRRLSRLGLDPVITGWRRASNDVLSAVFASPDPSSCPGDDGSSELTPIQAMEWLQVSHTFSQKKNWVQIGCPSRYPPSPSSSSVSSARRSLNPSFLRSSGGSTRAERKRDI